jgi:hypothetical protein
MCREANWAMGRTDPVEAGRTTIRSLPNHRLQQPRRLQSGSKQASGHLASTPLFWPAGLGVQARRKEQARGVRSVKSGKSGKSQESEDSSAPSLEPRTGSADWSSGTCDWTALCSSLRGGILGAMRQGGGTRRGREEDERRQGRGGPSPSLRLRADGPAKALGASPPPEVAQPHLPTFERAGCSDFQRLPARPWRRPVVTMVCSALLWLQCDVRYFGRCACTPAPTSAPARLHACFPRCTLRPISLPLGS